MTFTEVHEALQIAFNWASIHAHSFNVWTSDFKGMTMNSVPCGPNGMKMTIGMKGISDIGLPDDEPSIDEDQITLEQVYEDPRFKGKAVIGYEYDHGDSWAHDFCLLGRASPDMSSQMYAPDTLKVLCLGEEGHHVAEDCGSGDGWEDLKNAFKRGKRGDPEDLRGWYETCCVNGGREKFDPFSWHILEVNERLARPFSPQALEQRRKGVSLESAEHFQCSD